MLAFEEVARRIAASPFSRLLGVELEALEPCLRVRLDAASALEGRPGSGFVHGGILATLIDTSGSFAVIARNGASVATVDLLVDYHRPAPLGPIFATAEIVKAGRTISTTRTKVTDADGKLVASGRAAFVTVPEATDIGEMT